MKIGFDFGSTYSTLARYDSELDLVESLVLAESEPASIPSVVSIGVKKQKVTCGRAAKDHIGTPGKKVFEAFKMLLPMDDPEMLKSRGYDSVYTPQRITELFISSAIRNALNRYHEETVDSLVICVPEIWSKKIHTFNGRNALLGILERISDSSGMIDKSNIRVVNEPEAASAFIAYNYEKLNKSKGIDTGFNGHLLLIDYGGGTLDLTLTEVASDGSGSMEIRVREDGGEGENHFDRAGKNEIGCAGIAFMQNVVLSAIRSAGMLDDDTEPDYSSAEFLAAVKSLESDLKNIDRIKEIENAFDIYSSYSECAEILDVPDEDDEFTSIFFAGEEIPVLYKQLYVSYRDFIEPVLNRETRIINEKTMRHIGMDPCDPDAGQNNDFKIAVVGGFGNFYFVRKQLAQIYNLDPNTNVDPRMTGIPDDRREQAISLGAALISANRIRLRKTAKFSIGLYTTDGYDEKGAEHVNALYYGIKFRQEIIPDKPYFVHNPDGSVATWACLNRNIRRLAIEFSDREDCGGLLDLKPEMIEKLDRLPSEGFWQCAFSMDCNEVVSMVFFEKSILPGVPLRDPIKITLDNYDKMFNLTNVLEVKV